VYNCRLSVSSCDFSGRNLVLVARAGRQGGPSGRAATDANNVREPRSRKVVVPEFWFFRRDGTSSCFGTWGNWTGMCLACRKEESVYERDPCLAKFERGYGFAACYGPMDERGSQCTICAGRVDKRKLPEGVAPSAKGGGSVRSAKQLEETLVAAARSRYAEGLGRTTQSLEGKRRCAKHARVCVRDQFQDCVRFCVGGVFEGRRSTGIPRADVRVPKSVSFKVSK
jgi:hypothetical protein